MNVAPCVGAWVEILKSSGLSFNPRVAPCVGAWVEMQNNQRACSCVYVAPCVGAWVEMFFNQCHKRYAQCRPLCGGVG